MRSSSISVIRSQGVPRVVVGVEVAVRTEGSLATEARGADSLVISAEAGGRGRGGGGGGGGLPPPGTVVTSGGSRSPTR